MPTNDELQFDQSTRASELVSVLKALGNRRQNMRLTDAWADMLNVPKSSEEFYTIIAGVSRGLERLIQEISQSQLRDASKATYVSAAKKLKRYVAVDQMHSLTSTSLADETDAFRLLTLLDDVLVPNANRIVPDSVLDEWMKSVNQLIESAKEAFADLVLREFVVRQLSSLQWAIQNFHYLGIDGVSRTYGAMFAELARSTGMKGGQTPEARSWFQKAKAPLIAIGVAIAATSATVEQADGLIEHAGNIYEAIAGGESDKGKRNGESAPSGRSEK